MGKMVLIVSSFTTVQIFFCETSQLVYTFSPFFPSQNLLVNPPSMQTCSAES